MHPFRSDSNSGKWRGRFDSTSWSLVLAASGRSTSESRDALESLCKAYWYPIYAFIRRRGFDPNNAADLTQGFFARILEKNVLAAADADKGKFRTFLLTVCQNYLANESDRAAAKKRGGGVATLSIDCREAEHRYASEPSHELTAERLYEREWAIGLLDQTLRELEDEYRTSGRSSLFEALKPGLSFDAETTRAAEIAAALGMTETAVRKAAHRLRKRYRDALRERVAATLDESEDLEDEFRALLRILSR